LKSFQQTISNLDSKESEKKEKRKKEERKKEK